MFSLTFFKLIFLPTIFRLSLSTRPRLVSVVRVAKEFLLSNLTVASKITGIDNTVKLYLHQSAFGRCYFISQPRVRILTTYYLTKDLRTKTNRFSNIISPLSNIPNFLHLNYLSTHQHWFLPSLPFLPFLLFLLCPPFLILLPSLSYLFPFPLLLTLF